MSDTSPISANVRSARKTSRVDLVTDFLTEGCNRLSVGRLVGGARRSAPPHSSVECPGMNGHAWAGMGMHGGYTLSLRRRKDFLIRIKTGPRTL